MRRDRLRRAVVPDPRSHPAATSDPEGSGCGTLVLVGRRLPFPAWFCVPESKEIGADQVFESDTK